MARAAWLPGGVVTETRSGSALASSSDSSAYGVEPCFSASASAFAKTMSLTPTSSVRPVLS